MKKWWICLFCLLLCPAFALAAAPDEELHEAVMTLMWPDDNGECWVEGRAVLDELDKGDTPDGQTGTQVLKKSGTMTAASQMLSPMTGRTASRLPSRPSAAAEWAPAEARLISPASLRRNESIF